MNAKNTDCPGTMERKIAVSAAQGETFIYLLQAKSFTAYHGEGVNRKLSSKGLEKNKNG